MPRKAPNARCVVQSAAAQEIPRVIKGVCGTSDGVFLSTRRRARRTPGRNAVWARHANAENRRLRHLRARPNSALRTEKRHWEGGGREKRKVTTTNTRRCTLWRGHAWGWGACEVGWGAEWCVRARTCWRLALEATSHTRTNTWGASLSARAGRAATAAGPRENRTPQRSHTRGMSGSG